jgi:hypothetical protein
MLCDVEALREEVAFAEEKAKKAEEKVDAALKRVKLIERELKEEIAQKDLVIADLEEEIMLLKETIEEEKQKQVEIENKWKKVSDN